MTDTYPKSRRVYALGETVLDLVSDGGYTLQAVPGGSVLNAAVSLGRMGTEINLISEFGADQAGTFISNFLNTNHVQTEFCARYTDNKTSLALALLDHNRNATYSFYHDSPVTIQYSKLPDFGIDDILLFGSYYSVKKERRDCVLKVLQKAVEAKSIIYYDLNIRKAHAAEMDQFMPSFMNNISVATIVKGSDEDFYHLFGISDPEEVYEKINKYCKILIVTNATRPVKVYTPSCCRTYNVKEIIPVSTIGAGDNFNAGVVYGLATYGLDGTQLASISDLEMDRIISCGLAFAAEASLSSENYIGIDFVVDFLNKYI